MPLSKEHSTASSPYSPFLDSELAGCLVSSTWISFITRTLTTSEMLGRSDVAREFERLEKSGALPELRRTYQQDVDLLLYALLNSPPPLRTDLCLQAGLTLQALALDRVYQATFRLVGTTSPDSSIPVATVQPLIALFQKTLYREPGA